MDGSGSGKEGIKMKEKQNRRWGLMILSLLCGFLVWLGAVNIADPVITDTVEVPIEIINDEVLTRDLVFMRSSAGERPPYPMK